MSKKSNTLSFVGGISMLSMLLGILACDPCRELAEQMCECKESELEIRQCKTDLNLAKSHKFFEIAKEPKICEEALEKCSCLQLMRGQDEKCGIYREALGQ